MLLLRYYHVVTLLLPYCFPPYYHVVTPHYHIVALLLPVCYPAITILLPRYYHVVTPHYYVVTFLLPCGCQLLVPFLILHTHTHFGWHQK